jgi:probable F420-dependent oxidoreductase
MHTAIVSAIGQRTTLGAAAGVPADLRHRKDGAMKFGLRYGNLGRYVDGPAAIELAQAAEAAGFESIWTIEHVVVPRAYQSRYPYSPSGRMGSGMEDFPIPDPLVWLTYVGAVTRRIKLGTAILILPQRNPVITAKAVATLDHLAGAGRVLLGIGVGWLAEEFATLGVPFDDRGARADEYVAAMRALWSQECASFHGRFVSFTEVFCRPRPAAGRIPIIVGGDTQAAARRAGRLGDGYFPARGASPELFDEMRRAAEAAGRDPASIEVTVSAPTDIAEIEALARRGIARVAVPVSSGAGLPAQVRTPDDVLRYGKEVIARLRD